MNDLDNIYDDGQDKPSQEQLDREFYIHKAQNFLKKTFARQWNVISIEFGEQLFRDKNFNYHSLNTEYSIREIKDKKGLNYGTYELSYFHHAIILTQIDLKKIERIKTLTVIPIQTKFRPKSFKLKAQYNRFLEYDSHLLLDSISTIGIERINIIKTQNLSRSNQLAQVNPKDLIEIKTEIKKLYNL